MHQLAVSAEDIMQKRRDRLHLWQIFFANPYEWWDNRNSKLNPRMPDFKHKDTGEALWLTDNDPPWINQQLESLDSRLSKPRNGRSNLSPLVFDDWAQMVSPLDFFLPSLGIILFFKILLEEHKHISLSILAFRTADTKRSWENAKIQLIPRFFVFFKVDFFFFLI